MNKNFNEVYENSNVGFNQFKGTDRIQINNILSAISVAFIVILVSANSDQGKDNAVLAFIAISIPMLVTSSLAYSKITYRPINEYSTWNLIGWSCHTIGYFLILDAIGILLYVSSYVVIAKILFGTTVFLVFIYCLADVSLLFKKRIWEKLLKFCIYLTLIGVGYYLATHSTTIK